MRNWIKRLVFVLPIVFCAFHCDGDHETSYYIVNRTDETVLIQSYIMYISEGNPKDVARLAPGQSVEFYSVGGACGDIGALCKKNYCVLLINEDGFLLRNWQPLEVLEGDYCDLDFEECNAYMFERYGIRQFHNEKEWIRVDYEGYREWTFEIRPEDLIPLSEIVENSNK